MAERILKKHILASGLFLLVFSTQSLSESSSLHQTILSDQPLSLTSCPMQISAGAGGQVVRCIKLTRPVAGSCTTACSVSPGASITSGSFTLPASGGTIHYTLDGLNASYANSTVCASSCVGNRTSSLKLTLYSDSACTTSICTTGCNSGVSCTSTTTLSECPTTQLSCT